MHLPNGIVFLWSRWIGTVYANGVVIWMALPFSERKLLSHWRHYRVCSKMLNWRDVLKMATQILNGTTTASTLLAK
jgi:hypothetical protein